MSISTDGVAIPEWDLADRLSKSLRVAGMTAQEMADYLEVHRNSVSAWMNGRIMPSGQTIRLWALRTGVPYEWVRNGVNPSDSPDGPGGGKRLDDSTPDLPVRSPACPVIPIFPGADAAAPDQHDAAVA
jgi:transcriptional regulator with XRE-family HTH domain